MKTRLNRLSKEKQIMLNNLMDRVMSSESNVDELFHKVGQL